MKMQTSKLRIDGLCVNADQAFVTLATIDNYAKGAMVLGQSLRNHNTTRKLVALIGPHVSEPSRYCACCILRISVVFCAVLGIFFKRDL